MTRTTIPMAIAGLSTFIHVCMTLFTTYALISVIIIMAEPDEDEDGNSTLVIVGSVVITILVISLLLEIAVTVVSVFLILGIKRERHQFIAPWIYLTGIYTALSCIGLIKGPNTLDVALAIKIIIIILHAAIWYPIYKYWRDLTTTRNTNIPENSPLSVGFTTQMPGTIYNAGPDNWQQGQAGASYYPPPGYGPQMQTGVGYYPVQNYAGGQIQPSVNPQLASASYPRQTMTTAEGTVDPPSYAKKANE